MVDNRGGIYCIRNLLNEKRYVGSAINLRIRKSCHFSDLRRNVHRNQYLQNSYNKHNAEDYIFEILEYIKDPRNSNKFLLEREDYWQDFYKSNNPEFGYNIRKKAANNLGCHHSEETKKKKSESLIGHSHSENTKQKISESRKGSSATEETKNKMSETHLGENNAMYGNHHSEETKQKISNSKKGTQTGENNPSAKLTVDKVGEIKKCWKMNIRYRKLQKYSMLEKLQFIELKTNKHGRI